MPGGRRGSGYGEEARNLVAASTRLVRVARRLAWLVLAADVAYWVWQMGHVNAESGLPTWHTILNIVTVCGGLVLLLALLLTAAGRRMRKLND